MKLFIFIYDLGGGGAERVVSRFARWAARNRPELELHVLMLGDRVDYAMPAAVQVHRLSSSHRLGWQFTAAVRFIKLVRQHKPNAILSLLPWPNLIASLAAAGLPRWPRTWLSERSHIRHMYAGLRYQVLKLIARFLYRHADGVICVSKGVREELLSFGVPVPKLRVITNAVDSDEVGLAARNGWSEKDLGAVVPTFVSVGRLTRLKGHDTAILAIAQLKRNDVTAHLRILGQGPCEAELKALAIEQGVGDRIHFEGFRSNPFPAFRGATAFVLASRVEGFPNALLEALSMGLPCISSDCESGPRELLGNNEHGLLFPVNDHQALAVHMRNLIEDPGLRERLAVAASARAQQFSEDAVFGQYLSCLGFKPDVEVLR